MKKLLCMLFSLALVVATLTPVALLNVEAATTASMSAKADKSTYHVDDTVTVTFSLDADLSNVKSGSIEVSYDSSVFTVNSSKKYTKWKLEDTTLNPNIDDQNKGAFAYDENWDIDAGEVYQLTLTAIANGTDKNISATFNFKTMNSNSEEVVLASSTASTTVTVAHTWEDEKLEGDSNLKTPVNCKDHAVYYKVCSVCGEVSDTETFEDTDGELSTVHTGGTATCSSKAVCEKCGQEYGELDPTNHSYEDEYNTSETQHWKECSLCGNEGTKTDHTFELKSDGTNHWQECSVCGYKKDVTAHTWEEKVLADGTNLKSAATCTSYAVYYKVCSVCGEISTTETFEYEAGGYADHEWETTWTSNNLYHWHKCTNSECTEADAAAVHTFVQKSDENYHWQECSVCGYKKDIVAHTYEGEYYTSETQHWQECGCGVLGTKEEHTFVTESDNTYHWDKCSVCGYETEKEKHNVRDIILDDGSNLKTAATETSPAVYYAVCDCGYFDKNKTFEEETYELNEGSTAAITWTGSGTLVITSSADINKLVDVRVDGEVVNSANYEAKSGSTIITFTEEYLKTLSVGEHSIVIKSEDGSAKGKFTVAQQDNQGKSAGSNSNNGSATSTATKTGDNSNTLLWIMVTIAAGLALTFVFVAPRKRKH